MALIKCNKCGKEISDKAKKCIHCNYPIKSETNKNNILFIFSILIILTSIFSVIYLGISKGIALIVFFVGIVLLFLLKRNNNKSIIIRIIGALILFGAIILPTTIVFPIINLNIDIGITRIFIICFGIIFLILSFKKNK